MTLRSGARSTLETDKKNKPKKRRKKRNLSTRKSIIKRLDKLCSQYIRIKYVRPDGLVPCCTCNKAYPPEKMQCGHFMSRRYNNTRFHPTNITAQCRGCNMFAEGRQWLMGRWLDKEHGAGTAEDMYNLSRSTNKLSMQDLHELEREYEQRTRETLTKDKQSLIPNRWHADVQ